MKRLVLAVISATLITSAAASETIDVEQVERSLTTAAVCEKLFEITDFPVESKAISLAANEIIQVVSQGDMAAATGILMNYDRVKKWTEANLRSGQITPEDATHMYLGCSEILKGLDEIAVNDNLPSFTERAHNAN